LTIQAPQPLTALHQLERFDCGKAPLNEWLTRRALQAQSSGSAKTFVAAIEQRVVGYFSLTVGQVDTAEVPERVRKGMGRYPIPVVLLARLAVDSRHQGEGIGVGLLQDAIARALLISDQAGVRALLTHPIDQQAAEFYLSFGFVPSPTGPDHLLLLLKDARKLLGV